MEHSVFSYVDSRDPAPRRWLVRLAERLSGAQAVERLYLESRADMRRGETWFAASLRRLRVDVRFDAAALAAAPRQGPLLIVANHPFGVLDGLVLIWLVSQIRSDVRVLTNAVLLRAPEMRDWVLPIDFSGTRAAQATNVASRAAARDHLAQGGALVLFPAGGVSTSPDPFGFRTAVDARWQPIAGQLTQRSGATVLPVFFEGQNSRLFQIASHIHPVLRLGLFFHELRRQIGARVAVRIGAPIPFADLAGLDSRQAIADALREATDALSRQPLPR